MRRPKPIQRKGTRRRSLVSDVVWLTLIVVASSILLANGSKYTNQVPVSAGVIVSNSSNNYLKR